jgi:Fur family ferric uptake transcriptional regulator
VILPQILKDQGYRLTKQREHILKSLTEYPLSAEDIYKKLLSKHIPLDLASVYRTLELFINMGIVYSIDLGEGKKRYELINKKNHHHHLICNKCRKVEDIKVYEDLMEKELQKKTKYKIDHHHLEFFGLCPNCQ